MSAPMEAVDLPTDGTSAPITYTVGTSAVYGGDEADPVSFDAGTPVVGTEDPLYLDEGDTSIELTGTRRGCPRPGAAPARQEGCPRPGARRPAAPATATTAP